MELCRHKNYRNADYLSWLRGQQCLASGSPADCAHHVRLGTNGGKGIKPSDYFCIPLTHDFHTKGPHALHLIGEKTFLSTYKIEIIFVFIDQLRRYLIDKYQFKSNQMFSDPLIELESLVSEIEIRRPVECLKKKKFKAKPAKNTFKTKLKIKKKMVPNPVKASETEYYQKAKEFKKVKDRELRASLKEKNSSIITKKDFSTFSPLSKENEFYQKAKKLKKAKDKEMREQNKSKQSEIRKELYQKSKALKKEREKELRS